VRSPIPHVPGSPSDEFVLSRCDAVPPQQLRIVGKHVQKITLTPEGRAFIASGSWDLLGEGGVAVTMVPGTGSYHACILFQFAFSGVTRGDGTWLVVRSSSTITDWRQPEVGLSHMIRGADRLRRGECGIDCSRGGKKDASTTNKLS
jgi:hypothetical protein